ncbi:MAG: hypothetical protein BWY78_00885 [Alphaproteobacteria bacterium ADurb.Bin438]|nr:MAG: hypothetical protein BWY78_00885 [Alphaproteobacteria bacterium ADurb.Bin438]
MKKTGISCVSLKVEDKTSDLRALFLLIMMGMMSCLLNA